MSDDRSAEGPLPAYDAGPQSPIRYKNLPLLLAQAREAVVVHFRPILNHFGLTEQQWRVLRTLVEQGEMEQRLIAEACQLLGPSLAGILTRMEEMGLIERRKVPTDQRRVLVRVTAKTCKIVEEMAPLITQQYRHLEDAMGRDFIEALFHHLHQLLALQAQPIEHVALPPRRLID